MVKITEKVSFNIASEASYVYILSGQKLIKNAKKWSILARFWKPCGQSVLPDRSLLKRTKIGENANIQKFKCDILSNFQSENVWKVIFKQKSFIFIVVEIILDNEKIPIVCRSPGLWCCKLNCCFISLYECKLAVFHGPKNHDIQSWGCPCWDCAPFVRSKCARDPPTLERWRWALLPFNFKILNGDLCKMPFVFLWQTRSSH